MQQKKQSRSLLPPNQLGYDYSTSQFIKLSQDGTKLICRNGLSHKLDYFHNIKNGAMSDQNAIQVDKLIDLRPGLRFVRSDDSSLIDSGGKCMDQYAIHFIGLSNIECISRKIQTQEPFMQVVNYFEVFVNFEGIKNVQCYLINNKGTYSTNLQINISGPTVCGVLLDYSQSKLLIMDVLKSKKLFSYQIDYTTYPPPLKFAFDSNFQFYVNPHASFENQGELAVLNQQIYGANILPLIRQDLDFNLLKVIKTKQAVELKKVSQLFLKLFEQAGKISESIDIGSGFNLALSNSKQFLQIDKIEFESLYTQISTNFTYIIKSPIPKLAYNKNFTNESEIKAQTDSMRSLLNQLFSKISNEQSEEQKFNDPKAQFFQNPCSYAVTAIQNNKVLKNLPKFCLNESLQSKLNTFPYITHGFNVQKKYDIVTISFEKNSLLNQMKVLNLFIERVFKVNDQGMSAVQRLILKIIQNVSKKVQIKSGRVHITARFIDLASFTSLLMSACYDKIGSKTQKKDESILTKQKGDITKKNKASKNKSATADQVIDVDSDENIGIAGLFGDSQDEDYEGAQESQKIQKAQQKPAVVKEKEQDQAKVEKKEKEEEEKKKKLEEDEKKDQQQKVIFTNFNTGEKIRALNYFEALRCSLIMDQILYCAASQSQDLIKEFWPLISRPHSSISKYSSLTFNNGDGSSFENIVLEHGHSFQGGSLSDISYAGAITNPRRCSYGFMPQLPKANREITLFTQAYPLTSFLLQYSTVPLAVTLSHFPSIKFKSSITHVRLAENFPLFAVATNDKQIHLLFSIFKLAGIQSFDAFEYVEYQSAQSGKQSGDNESKEKQGGVTEKVGAHKGDDQTPSDQVIEQEEDHGNEGEENQGMFGNLFDQPDEYQDEPTINKIKQSYNKQTCQIVDFATRLTIQTCYFFILIKDEANNLRLSVHTLLDKHQQSCNSGIHYDISKQKFINGVRLTSRPIELNPDTDVQSWQINQVQVKYSNSKMLGYNIFIQSNQNSKRALVFIESNDVKVKTDAKNFIVVNQIKIDDDVHVAPSYADRKKNMEILRANGVNATDAVEEFANQNIVYCDDIGEIQTFVSDAKKQQELELAKELVKNNNQEDALQSYASELMDITPLAEQEGNYKIKIPQLPSNASSVTLNVIFQGKSMKNLEYQKRKQEKALLQLQDFKAIPQEPIGLELISLNDDPSLGAKYTSKLSYNSFIKPSHSPQSNDFKLSSSFGGKYKMLYRTFNGNAAYVTSISFRSSLKVKATNIKIVASNTLDGLIGTDFEKMGQVRGCEGPYSLADNKKEYAQYEFDKPVYGKYFFIQITQGNSLFQNLQLRGVEIKDFTVNYSSALEYFSGYQIETTTSNHQLNIGNWTDLFDTRISFASIQIPVDYKQCEFTIKKSLSSQTSIKPFTYQVILHSSVENTAHIRKNLLNFETQQFKDILKLAASSNISALSLLGRMVNNQSLQKALASKIKNQFLLRNIIRAIILKSECVSDIYNLLSLAKFLFIQTNTQDYHNAFRQEIFKISRQLLYDEKLYLMATHQNASLIGLEFCINAYNRFFPSSIKDSSYTFDLVKQIYQDIFINMAKKAKDNSKFIKSIKDLIEGLPGIRFMKNQAFSATHMPQDKKNYRIKQGARVLTHLVCKFQAVDGLQSPQTAMIKSLIENVYFSSSFYKPGARYATFEIHDLAKEFDLGFSFGFSAIFYKLAGRNPKKIDFKPFLKANEDEEDEKNSNEIGQNKLKTVLALLNSQTITKALIDRLHKDTKAMEIQSFFMLMKKQLSPLLEIPYFQNTLLGLLSSHSGQNTVSHQLTANLLEPLRIPFVLAKEIQMRQKSAFEDQQRQKYQEMVMKHMLKAMKMMPSTLQMIQNIEINASCIICYMKKVFDKENTNSSQVDSLWLKRNYIWIAACLQLLNSSNQEPPKSALGNINVQEWAVEFDESKNQIIHKSEAESIYLQNNKANLTNHYKELLNRFERALNTSTQFKPQEIAKGNTLDKKNLKVLLTLIMRLTCKLIEKNYFTKLNLPGSLVNICYQVLELDSNGQMKQLIMLLQGNSRNQGANMAFPAYKVIQKMIEGISNIPPETQAASKFITNLRFLARFINIYDANLTRVISKAVPDILKHQILKNQTDLISWMTCFFQKTSYYLPVHQHQNIVDFTSHVIEDSRLMRCCDQFSIVNLMTAMSGYDQNDPEMKDKFKDKLAKKIMSNFHQNEQIIDLQMLQIYKQYINNCSMYAKDFARLHKLLMLKVLPSLRKWSNDEPACGQKKVSAIVQFAGVLCGRIFQVKQVDILCDNIYREWQKEELDQMVENMISWILLNPHTKWKAGHDGLIHDQKTVNFNDLILRFFLFFTVKKQFREAALRSMVRNVQILDDYLIDQRFSIKLAISIAKHVNSIFGSLLKLCLSDQSDIELFMVELKGIQFLKKRLNLKNKINGQKQEDKNQESTASLEDIDLFKKFNPQKFLPVVTNVLKSNSMHFNTDILSNLIDIKKKFHKNQIQSNILSDEKNKLLKNAGNTTPKSWCPDTKYNSTTSLYTLSYNCQYFFEFVQAVEIESLMIGFMNKLNNCSRPVPEFITLYYGYGGSDTTHLQSIEMPRIYDPRFNQANVFGVNFHSLQGNMPSCLEKAKGVRVKYIGFTMDSGWPTGLNQSLKSSQLTNAYSDNINFIQVNGFRLNKIGNYLQKVAKSSSKATIDLVSQIGSEYYARKYAEDLSRLMPFDDGKLMRSYLLESSKPATASGQQKKTESNKQTSKNDAFFRFITILAQKSPLHVIHFSDMVFQVLKAGDSPSPKLERFILNLCLNLGQTKQINEIEQRLVSLIVESAENNNHAVANRVAKLFLKYLHRKSKIFQAKNTQTSINSFQLSHFTKIAQVVQDPSSADQQLQNLVKFFIYPPNGIKTSFSKDEILKSLNQSQRSPAKSFISMMNMGDASLAQSAFEKSEKDILTNIEQGLKQKKDYKAVFTGLLTWSSHPSIRTHLAKSGLGKKIYILAKESISENFPKLLLDYLLQILRKLTYGFPELQEELSQIINEDQELFGNDIPGPGRLKFYESIVFPLLFGEQTVSICFNPFFERDKTNKYLSLYDQPAQKKSTSQTDLKEDLPFKLSNFPKQYKKALGSNFKKVFGASSLAVLNNYNIGSFEGKFTMGQLSIYSPAFIYGYGTDTKTSKNYLFGLFSLTYVDSLFYERLKDQGFSSISCIYIYCKQTGQKLHFRWINTGIGNKMITRNSNLYYVGTKEKFFIRFEVKDYSNGGTVFFGQSKPANLKDHNLYCVEGEDQYKSFPWPDQNFKPSLFYSGFNAPYFGNVNALVSKFFTSKFDFLPAFFRGDENSAFESLDSTSCFEVGGSELLEHPWHYKYSIVNKLNPVWNVPKGACLNFITQHIFGSMQKCYFQGKKINGSEVKISQIANSDNQITIDIDIDVGKALGVGEKQQEENKEEKDEMKAMYFPNMGIFDNFSKKAGFHKIALVVQNKVKALPPANRKNQAFPRLQQWLREVEDFSAFPQFDTIFLANNDCRDFILQDVIRGSSVLSKFCERQAKIANAPFDTLGQLFRAATDVGTLRTFAFQNKLVMKLIDALQGMTHQIKRYKIGDEELQKIEQGLAEERQAESNEVDVLPVFEVPTQDNTKKKKRKGVGYSSSEGKVWDVTAYLQNREKKNQRVASLVDLLVSLLDTNDWHPSRDHMEQFYQSALLPFLENMFSACSLVEMAKDYVLFVAVFKFIKIILKHDQTIKLLQPIDPHYRPSQRASLIELMKKLNSLAQIFLSVSSKKVKTTTTDENSNDAKAEKLASTIDSLYKQCRDALANRDGDDQQAEKLKMALKLPIRKAYPTILGDLRFDYMQIPKEGNKYKHYFESQASGETNPPASKMVRLAQELADLSNALPIDYTNAMFIRVDKERIDLMKAVICGANGTPYAHGIFQYDLYLPNNYPNTNPKCNLMTTGNSQVRFNPNLYSNGYVCLSLLGTWRGNANENWDPKLSTILQLLLSIQAVVMSEQVYFNEPGYENTAGTPDGEKKNEGYTNIVRYCNIKFAMIEMIKKPIKGFQEVIRRHFYLKRDQVMNEVSHWIKLSEKNQADYNGLVSSHNWQWCDKFKKSKDAYPTALKEIVLELEKQLKKVEPPKIRQVSTADSGKEGAKKKQIVDFKQNVQKLEDVDVGYNEEVKVEKQINIDDEKVKDRWSRYIGAMGVQAVAKQAAATVLVCGAGGAGIEISKNIVLAGCKEFYLWDDRVTTYSDLSSQFFLSHKDVGKNRALSSLQKLQQLNFYVKCKAFDGVETPIDSELIEKIDPDVVIMTDSSSEEEITAINKLCRESKGKIRKFVLSQVYGLCSRVFTDFGAKFEVLDKNGEELQDVMIKQIRQATQAEVPKPKKKGDDDKDFKEQVHRPVVATCLTGVRHNYQDGDQILIQQVVGMDNKSTKKSINGSIFKVTVVKPDVFIINDLVLSDYTKYEQNGIAKQLKQKVPLTFEPYQEARKIAKFDANLWISDFQKMGHWAIMHQVFPLILNFKKKNGLVLDEQDAQNELLKQAEELIKKKHEAKQTDVQWNKQTEYLVSAMALTAAGNVNPICAFIGGFVAQEIVKAITGKFTPISQWFYYDALELFPKQPQLPKQEENKKQEEKKEKLTPQQIQDAKLKPIAFLRKKLNRSELKSNLKQTRADGLKLATSHKLSEQVAKVKLFMIGAGAIGCELLKNYAMLGIGSHQTGMIVLTDPDVIQVSNLNRQFLFREKHLRKPKASTAAAAALDMNPQLKGRVYARLDKVHNGTEHIYTDKFFEDLTIVTNALDNIAARRYVDSRCITARTPLLESGTLGPKGHVQVILPGKTQSYGSQADPQNNTDIPQCTLKMFPEETLHCVEWARDLFEKLFTQHPKQLIKVLDPDFKVNDSTDVTALTKAMKLLRKRPKSWNDCVTMARLKFQKYFVNDILQLLYAYPLDKVNKDGRLFWSSPKRPPHAIKYEAKSKLHSSFVISTAFLFAKIYGIKIEVASQGKNLRKDEKIRAQIASSAEEVKVKEFKPDKKKAQDIAKEVQKDENKKQGKVEEEQVNEEEVKEQQGFDVEEMLKQLAELKKTLPSEFKPKPQTFEKDDDQNGHIDFIHSLANCRSENYKLQQMEWINVKIKAGRIVPALATTTAAVAGLQALELLKYVAGCSMENQRNVFLNLALPSMTASEPGPPESIELREGLKVNLWDRWDVYDQEKKDKITLGDFIAKLGKDYQLHVRDVMRGNKPIFFYALMNAPGKEKDKEKLLKENMTKLLDIGDVNEEGSSYADLTVTFCKNKDDKDILKGVPPVRIYFVEKKENAV